MTCSWVKVDGHLVHIRHSGPRMLPCIECGEISTRLCDWKVGKSGATCDAALCDKCTSSPARGKDLCPEHAAVWAAHPDNVKARQAELDL